MKSKLIGILVIIVMLVLIIPADVFAEYTGIDTDVTIGESDAARSSEEITGRIVGTLQVAGTIISVIALIIIGMRYMFSSLETKAQMKGVIGYYITGCVLVFATSNVLGFAYGVVEDVQHDWIITRVEPTCTTAGYIYRECGHHCNKTEREDISAYGHNYGNWSITQQATCTANGNKRKTCSNCGNVQNQSIRATGHSFGNYSVTVAATCTTNGTEKRVCSRCNTAETQSIPKLTHNMGRWTTTTEANCTTAGSKKRTCTRSGCSHSETQTIAALNHNYENWTITRAATCTTTGSKKSTCSRNGCSASTTQSISAKGHSMPSSWTVTTAATCTATGTKKKTCTRSGCSHSETQTIAVLGHSYTTELCYRYIGFVDVGTQYTCSRCGDSYKDWSTW